MLIFDQIPKSNWRQKHQDFIRSIRYAKQVSNYEKAGMKRKQDTKTNQLTLNLTGGRLADLPPPPASVNPDYVQCPHCGRNYAPSVAERHIPKCVNIQNKPRPPPGFNRMGTQQRTDARIARAPISNFSGTSGGFSNNSAYSSLNRTTRGNRH